MPNDYQVEQHRKAGCILVQVTARFLDVEEHEVFRLAKSKLEGGCSIKEGKQHYAKWLENIDRRPVPDYIYDFCLDVMSHRVMPKKARKKGEHK